MRLSSLMSKAGRQKVLALFPLYLSDLWTHKSLRRVRVQEYDCSSTWTYHSVTRYFAPPPIQFMPVALLHICSPSFHLFSSPPTLHFPPLSPWSIASFFLIHSPISMPTTSTSHSLLCSTFLIFFFHLLHPSTPPPSSTLPLAFSPYIQKPHGGSASNLNMLGSPFVLLVQGPHNAVSSARDPPSADLIR